MGVFGAGLYSGDFAMDLRGAIGAVSRLPFDGDKLADILCETEPGAAEHPDDEDHTTFWLVAADQFAKRGIACGRVRERALAIIDNGSDLDILEVLGMSPSDLRKRGKILADLRVRLVAPPVDSRPRLVLKKPQAFVMETGDVLVYPTMGGQCINPYMGPREKNTLWIKDGPGPWRQDSWAAMVVVERGRAFDFLSWYRALTIASAMPEKPALASLRGEVLWKLGLAGTCSAVHFKRLELEKIGELMIDPGKLKSAFPDMRPGASQAIEDISLSNALSVAEAGAAVSLPKPGDPPKLRQGRVPTLLGIEQLLSQIPGD